MVRYTTGDLFEAQTEAIVNTVNTVGVMGKGIALQFKKRFPENYKQYRKACEWNEVKPGKLLVTQTDNLFFRYIVNFPTKTDWRKPSRYEYIEQGLEELTRFIKENDISSIALPPLGAGQGKLDWEKVRSIIDRYFSSLENVEVVVFEPQEKFAERDNKVAKRAKLTPIRALLLKSFDHYNKVDPSLNLLVTQKLSYFLQRLGEPLRLEFDKGHYGPYAPVLNKVLQEMNGVYLSYKAQQDKPSTRIRLLTGRSREVEAEFQDLTDEQKKRYYELLQFIEGFESPFSLELLATVDWIVREHPEMSPEEIYPEIGKWTRRKSELIKKHYVIVAFNHLMKNQNRLYERMGT